MQPSVFMRSWNRNGGWGLHTHLLKAPKGRANLLKPTQYSVSLSGYIFNPQVFNIKYYVI